MATPLFLPEDFPSPFAVEWGQDESGIFIGFGVERVVQRMRWIPAGEFLMGSPTSEVGRSKDEVQHRVELSEGFWLGDTPVTQALWEAVMGGNPSHFMGPHNPVETVSWNHCQVFIKRLNERVKGLDACLPTEAEWEYACRADTTTATWVGDLHRGYEDEGQLHDTIAWYRGNAEGSTHPVAQKLANPWGLYDMLGNVYEWCADWFALYEVDAASDPKGSTTGSNRVLRGGAWRSDPRYVRAADRGAHDPLVRNNSVGFRLARGSAPRPGSGARLTP